MDRKRFLFRGQSDPKKEKKKKKFPFSPEIVGYAILLTFPAFLPTKGDIL